MYLALYDFNRHRHWIYSICISIFYWVICIWIWNRISSNGLWIEIRNWALYIPPKPRPSNWLCYCTIMNWLPEHCTMNTHLRPFLVLQQTLVILFTSKIGSTIGSVACFVAGSTAGYGSPSPSRYGSRYGSERRNATSLAAISTTAN